MAIYEIPMDGVEARRDFRLSAPLSGMMYRFYFHYIARDDSWAFDFMTAGFAPILMGMRCVLNWDVLAQVKQDSRTGIILPTGFLYFIDSTDRNKPATGDDMGTRVVMVHDDGVGNGTAV